MSNKTMLKLRFILIVGLLALAASVFAVQIDKYNRCVVSGKLFFPIGISACEIVDSGDMDRIADMGFNCVADTSLLQMGWPLDKVENHLDEYHRRKLKLIFVLKDCYDGSKWAVTRYGKWNGSFEVLKGAVSSFRAHPAILAWLLNDEMSGERIPEIRERYNWIKKNDPNHPVYSVLYRRQDLENHTKLTDVFGVDAYPVYSSSHEKLGAVPMAFFGEATRAAVKSVKNRQAVWMMPECASQRRTMSEKCRPPTYEEMLCEAFQGLVYGARGIVFYNYTDLKFDGDAQMASVKRMVKALKEVEPFALGLDVDRKLELSTSNTRVGVATRRAGETCYALAVNPYYRSARARFDLGSAVPPNLESRKSGGKWRKVKITDRSFYEELEPLGVREFRWKAP